jgi:hypothetical protein
VSIRDDPELGRDPELERAARALAAGAVRFHPSFRFEERLAARIRSGVLAGPGQALRGVAGGPAGPLAQRVLALPVFSVITLDPSGGSSVAGVVQRVPKPVLVGGAIASGVSLAGAVVAWRRLRRAD